MQGAWQWLVMQTWDAQNKSTRIHLVKSKSLYYLSMYKKRALLRTVQEEYKADRVQVYTGRPYNMLFCSPARSNKGDPEGLYTFFLQESTSQ